VEQLAGYSVSVVTGVDILMVSVLLENTVQRDILRVSVCRV